jgi:hypothetical protein
MRLRYFVLAAGLCVVSSQALAQEEEAAAAEPAAAETNKVSEPAPAAEAAPAAAPAADGKAKYGNAGCGLGSMLFSPSNGFSQVFAATTNGTSASQTFGISSGTSNCDGAGFQPGSAAAFIQTNRAALAKDAARGRGATITGLSELAGCKSAKSVGRTLKGKFTTAFPGVAASDEQISRSVLQVLKSDRSLACTNIG